VNSHHEFSLVDTDTTIVAAVNESASVDEFLHVTKVHALATWDLLY